jgi:trehalose synthase
VLAVADDPESVEVYHECVDVWHALPHAVRGRVHLACLPMHDLEEQSVIVNALQRHAAIVTQKSLAEGFGLTVAEAMWKSRPVVASAVGGVVAQIEDGRDGLLVEDPDDLEAFAHALHRLLVDQRLAHSLGHRARLKIQQEFMPDRHLLQWAQLVSDLA